MTAAQLIAALQAYPPDAEVMVSTDDSYRPVETVEPDDYRGKPWVVLS